MKLAKLSVIAAIVLGGLVACSVATAQEAGKDASKKGKRGMSVDQRLDQLTTELKLTDAQKPKVKEALEATQKKMQELRGDTSLDQGQRREKMTKIMDEQKKKMKEILTPDQFKTWEESLPARGKKKKSE